MSIPLNGNSAQDFMPKRTHIAGFCDTCGLEITHKGTSPYCSLGCLKETQQAGCDTFAEERQQHSYQEFVAAWR